MTGGEPLMDKNTYEVLEYITYHPKPDLHLNVTSNMCPPNEKLKDKYFDMIKRICLDEAVEHMMQFVSVDAYGKKAEYIRFGLDFNRMLDNVDEFLQQVYNTLVGNKYLLADGVANTYGARTSKNIAKDSNFKRLNIMWQEEKIKNPKKIIKSR